MALKKQNIKWGKKMRSKILFIVLALMCLIGSISITAAQVTKIGTGHDPAIYGSKVTWSDTANIIHIYDLTAKKDTKICSSKASHPAIYGNKLVWHDESSGKPRLTVYDIPSGARSYITQNIDQSSIPVIYGNRIVWGSNSDIYMRDILASTQTKISTGNNPNIYDTKITYTYDNGDRPQVYVYDVATKKSVKTSSGGDLYNPHIYGNKIIWSDFNTRLGYISMYDLATKKIIDVTSDNAYSGDPNNPDAGDDTGFYNAIYGDKIVYAKIGNDQFGNAGVCMYSIYAGQSTPVFNYAAGVYTTPAIYDTTVVWGLDNSYGNNPINDNGIYVCDLAAKPVASFTANKVSGTHSLPVTFTYLGTGGGTPSSYHWDFGDKTTSDHALTATHTYTKAGTYTVSLKVTNAAGSGTAKKTAYIKVS
jgi:beta propeller repeat protein